LRLRDDEEEVETINSTTTPSWKQYEIHSARQSKKIWNVVGFYVNDHRLRQKIGKARGRGLSLSCQCLLL